MSQYIADICYSISSCLSCFPTPSLVINDRKFTILRLLGEGGFSYVYLVRAADGNLYALKKIRCPFGAESLQRAMREVEAYRTFKTRYVIRCIDFSIVQERDGSKTVFILLPYFRRGNLQDVINSHLVNQSHFTETEIINLFVEISKGVKAMHRHKLQPIPTAGDLASVADAEQDTLVQPGEEETVRLMPDPHGGAFPNLDNEEGRGGEGEEEDSRYSSASQSEQTLTREESTTTSTTAAPTLTTTDVGEIVSYAHCDIKPANIMLSPRGLPVIMDLGSAHRVPIEVTNRHQALEIQDEAAEHCTMPYRAPELFDVKTGITIDDRIDIWSLGCTLFALMYSCSPFEMQTAESGASMSLAVMNGQYKFPTNPIYSKDLKDIVSTCLTVDPKARPYIEEVLGKALRIKERLTDPE